MDNFLSDSDITNLAKELKRGKQLAELLQSHLALAADSPPGEYLLRQILNSFDHSLAVLSHGCHPAPPLAETTDVSESPHSLTGRSLHSEDHDSDQEFKDDQMISYTTADQVISGKRKGVEKWTKNIEVSPWTGPVDTQLGDGYGWRKYGQKNILGAKYPRAYYRCTYRYVKGCLAMKQIQRSDHHPNSYEITYRGHHSCDNVGNSSSCNPIYDLQREEKQISSKQDFHQPEIKNEQLMDIQTSLRAIPTQDSYTNKDPSYDPFHFLTSSSSLDLENTHFVPNDNEFLADYPSNFPISSSIMDNNHAGFFHNLHTTESELDRVVSVTTSANESTTLGVDFPFGTSSRSKSSA